MPRFRLFVDKIVSIGAVGEGDNPEARILFSKRKFGSEERDQAAARGAAMPDGSYPILTEQDLRNAIQAIGRAKNPDAVKRHIIRRARTLGATGMLPEEWTKDIGKATREILMEFDLSALDDDTRTTVEEFVADVERQRDDALAEIAKLREENDPEPVEKELPDDVQLLIKERDDRIAVLEETVEKARAEARDAEYVEKARELEPMLGNPDEVGPVLRRLADAAPDDTDSLLNMLKAAAQLPELASIFKEIGQAGGDEQVDVVAKRDEWVNDYMEKNTDTSIHKARAAFWKAHPEYASQMREEATS